METKVFYIYTLYNMFPKVITKEEVNEIIKKLKPYNVGINIIKLMQ